VNELGLIELFWRVNRRLLKLLAPVAHAEGMSMTEVVVLWKAHLAGSRRVTLLAEDLGVPPSTLTGVLDRLVEGGWLERGRDPDDRRAVVMKSTQKLGELMYTDAQAKEQAAAGGGGGGGGGGSSGGSDAKKEEKVVDAEYTEVNDRK